MAASVPVKKAPGDTSSEEGADEVKDSRKAVKPFKYNTNYSWFSRLFFFDVDPIIKHGYKTRLEPEHLFPEPSIETQPLIDRFQPAFEFQTKRAADLQKEAEKQKDYKPDQKPVKVDMRRVILAGNSRAFIITGILYLISQAGSLAGPLLLNKIVNGLQCQAAQRKVPVDIGCEPITKLYYYIIGLFIAPFVQSVCENHQTYLLYLLGTRMRNTLMAAIYRKCLRLSNSAMQEESVGRVVTLMSNDAQKLQDATTAIHAIWGSPLYIIAVLALLWFQVGWSTFVGLGVMLLLGPITAKLAQKLGSLRREILGWTDKRVGRMSELVNGIQMIKFYAWEASFKEEVMKYRNQEARILRITAFWQGLFGMILFAGPVAVALCCFGSYTIAGNTLNSAQAYTALALFALLRFPMSFLPMLITMLVNALVALKRIGKFLSKSEAHLEQWDPKATEVGQVTITDGSFAWDVAAEKPTLAGINLNAQPGSLTMIVGSVGSGKSSVLNALIGHITKTEGSFVVGGNIAYVAQTAWIMNDTLQENVLMGHDLDPERYQQALEVAQLGPDLLILPKGDLTEIGDRGITLSGGQKQRVSIARAVYCNADIFLLDDPLSAVDSHVGRALFEQCIRGALRGKTIVLVTNALQYLPHADQILWMEDGRIKAQGAYGDVLSAGLNIADLAHVEDEGKDQDTAAVRVDAAAGAKAAAEAEAQVEIDRAKFVAAGKITLVRAAADANRNLTGEESREAGTIALSVVKRYCIAGGGLIYCLLLIFFYGSEQGSRVYTDMWIGNWFGDKFGQGNWFYLGIYFMLGVVYSACTFARALTFLFFCVRASVSIHNQLLDHILQLPKSFFDTNPAGRILNRFSRDTDIMDATLSASLMQFITCVVTYIAILVVITIATYWFGIALVPLTIIYFTIQRYYIPSARELQRIESVTRSPIYSRFTEALQGVATIRAYRSEQHFTQLSDRLMRLNADAFVTQKLAASWLAMRLDLLGLIVLTICGALCIQGNIDPGMAGLALVYALDLTRFLKHGTNMASKSEADFNSVERIVQYLTPATEAAPYTDPDTLAKMDPNWPAAGAITVDKLAMRYRPGMPLVLRGISFEVKAGEKVGLVGRTGSGKSSLLLALFRMVEAESGRIIIDGIDISTLGLRHLRSVMSIIPQDPFMFTGTVRHNLDPLAAHQDEKLWGVLEEVGLKQSVSDLELKLDAPVVDSGNNFSLGQRQLFCLARAMLRRTVILMLDEATASVDLDTDNLLQSAIRNTFGKCTMLTIAHRLNTIMDSDRVIVLDQGLVVESDDPDVLLERNDGIFTGMVDQTGKSSARYLRSMASSAREMRSGRLGITASVGAMANLRSNSVLGSTMSFMGKAPQLTPSSSVQPTYSIRECPVYEGDDSSDVPATAVPATHPELMAADIMRHPGLPDGVVQLVTNPLASVAEERAASGASAVAVADSGDAIAAARQMGGDQDGRVLMRQVTSHEITVEVAESVCSDKEGAEQVHSVAGEQPPNPFARASLGSSVGDEVENAVQNPSDVKQRRPY